MSTATPSKHDRIERHIQRQRGAGVRSLATSFGFSFGLSHLTVPLEHARSPSSGSPAKRRKSSTRSLPDAGAPMLKPPRDFQTADKESTGGTSGQLDDDSPVKTQTGVKKRGNFKRATIDTTTFLEESTTKPVAKRRGRALVVVYDEDHNDPDLALATAEVAVVAKPLEPAGSVAHLQEPRLTMVKETGRPTGNIVVDEVVAPAVPLSSTTEVKLGQRPKRRAAAAATVPRKVLDGFTEENSDIVTKRREMPLMHTTRRPVAVVLQTKQNMHTGELPTTRRGPSMEMGEGNAAILVTNASDSECVKDDNTPGPTAGTSRQRKRANPDVEPTPASGPIPGRPKRAAAVAAHTKLRESLAEEATDITKQRRTSSPSCRKKQHEVPVTRSIPTLNDAMLERQVNVSFEVPKAIQYPSRQLVTQRRARSGVADGNSTLTDVRQPLAEIEVNVYSPELAPTDRPEKPEKPGRVRAKSSPHLQAQVKTGITATQKRKARSAQVTRDVLGEPAEVLTSGTKHFQAMSAPEGHASMPMEQLTRNKPATVVPSVHKGQNQDVRGSKASKMRASRVQAPLSLAEAQGSAPGDRRLDDVDWLSDSRESTKSTTQSKRPANKMMRKVVPQLPDMDLDELLSNIASFLPRGQKHR